MADFQLHLLFADYLETSDLAIFSLDSSSLFHKSFLDRICVVFLIVELAIEDILGNAELPGFDCLDELLGTFGLEVIPKARV